MKTNIKSLLKQMYRCRLLYLMILLGFVATFIFAYLPLWGIVVAFKDYSSRAGIWGSEWVGLKHFKRFLEYPYFSTILINTIRINVTCLIINFPLVIIFSLMLNEMKSQKLKRICQQITYMPYFISTVVVASMAILMLNRTGLINLIIAKFGGQPTDLMSEPGAFPFIYALTDTWTGLGWGTIIYLASLSGVSLELIEAARIDGAGRFRIIWHVNLPHLKPTIMTLLILNMGSMLSVGFEKVLLLQTPLNSSTSEVISTYSYQVGLVQQQLSYSSAIGLFNNVINVLFILGANKLSKKLTDVGLF
ncbi:MAG: sugar ABC transporter permease [Roseburia sp.]|nr:sugar ABC transporter permease [Roseburia sp.]